ncbi:unnamed protein product [Boreogadus saida]
MEEKRIVARDCLPQEPCCPLPTAARHHRLGAACFRDVGASAAGLWRKTIAGNIPFSSMSWFSLLQIDVDVQVEEPETSENRTQSSPAARCREAPPPQGTTAARHHRRKAPPPRGTLPASEAVVPHQQSAGLRQETIAGDIPFSSM